MLVPKADRPSWRLNFGLLLLVLLLILGVAFRCINLDRKVFWVDEVATAIRISGYTKAEVIEQLADGAPHTPAELLAYQHPADRSFPQILQTLQQSPEHAPLYFLLLRFWTQCFGSSVVALRSFSVLCSLLLLPIIYWLSWLLWGTDRAGWIAVGLFAISPFMIAYAQEARPYSLWLLTLALSSGSLLNALRQPTAIHWGIYAITLTAGLYTSLLTLGVALGHSIYVFISERHWNRSTKRFGIALSGAIVALLPWCWVLSRQWTTLQENTTWMRLPLPNFAKAVIWFYSAAVLYFDVPVVTHPPIVAATEIGLATAVVAIILYSFYAAYRQVRSKAWFLLTLALTVPSLLILLDLVTDGRYSTAPRYLLPFHLAAQLAVAFLLSDRLFHKQTQLRKWQAITAFLLAMCLLSNLIHLNTSPRYLKNRNLHNFPISEVVNHSHQPILLAESSNTIDLLSLSHSLNPQTEIHILSTEMLTNDISQFTKATCQDVLLFNPSPTLQQQLQQNMRLEQRYYPKLLLPGEFALSLWQVDRPDCQH